MRLFIIGLAVLVAVTGVASVTTAQTPNTNVTASGVQVPPDHRYERYDPSQGKYGHVDAKDVPGLVEKKQWIYDRTDKVWVYRAQGGLNPRYAAGAQTSSWQNIHGQVQTVSGTNLTLKADDGRTLTVDMAKVGKEIQQAMKPGMPVTVTGHEWSGPNQFRAEYIQQDSSAGVQPSALPTQPVDEKNWQRIHGKVSAVNGAQLTLKADDGRDLNVDMKDVNPEVQKALTPGEAVTVAGFYRGDDKHVTARFIQKDSSAR
jgi:outer membrane lipoprotein SlyB